MSGNSSPARRRPAVTVLARAPERGRVKTRLALTVGDDAALALHEALLLDVLERLRAWLGPAPGGRLVLALTGSPDALARARRLVEGHGREGLPGPRVEEQTVGDLGARIEEALARRGAEASPEASPGGSLVVGSDCPFLSDGLLDSAAAGVADGRIHLVPARDGGFVLIGGGRLPPGSLSGIEWGSERVLAQTGAALERAGLSASLGEQESDLDHLADLLDASPRLEAAPLLAPRTLAWLRTWARVGDGGTGGPHPG